MDNDSLKTDRQKTAVANLKSGERFPYDEATPVSKVDWAHKTARGCISELSNRRGIGNELEAVQGDDETLTDIVTRMADVIREGEALYNPGEMAINDEGDYSFTQTVFPESNTAYGGKSTRDDTFNVFVTDKTQTKGQLSVLMEPSWSTQQEQKKAHERHCSIEMSVCDSVVNEEPMPCVKITEPSGVILSIQQIPTGFLITHNRAHSSMQQQSKLSPETTHYAVFSKKNISIK